MNCPICAKELTFDSYLFAPKIRMNVYYCSDDQGHYRIEFLNGNLYSILYKFNSISIRENKIDNCIEYRDWSKDDFGKSIILPYIDTRNLNATELLKKIKLLIILS